jgi:hypothetical protein
MIINEVSKTELKEVLPKSKTIPTIAATSPKKLKITEYIINLPPRVNEYLRFLNILGFLKP